MYQLYQRVAPRPEDFGRLLDKLGELMSKDFDFSQEVRGLRVPTLIACADADMAPPSHYVESSSCWAAGSGTAAGWARAGRLAATRSRLSRARPTTTSSCPRCSPRRRSRSSTRPRARHELSAGEQERRRGVIETVTRCWPAMSGLAACAFSACARMRCRRRGARTSRSRSCRTRVHDRWDRARPDADACRGRRHRGLPDIRRASASPERSSTQAAVPFSTRRAIVTLTLEPVS